MSKLPKPLPKPRGGVPIIGKGPTFDADTTYTVAGIDFHPPMSADHGYAMAIVLLNGTPDMRKSARQFGMKAAGYLTEDGELGAKHTIVMIQPAEDGEVEFVVARPESEDPNKVRH